MKRASLLTLFLSLGACLVFLIPEVTHAQVLPNFITIVPSACNCTGSAANWGCVLQLLQNLFKDAVILGTLVITIFIAWAGIAYLMAPINAEGRQKAKTRLWNAIIGLVIVLCAWLLVNSLMNIIYNAAASGDGVSQLGAWNTLLADNNTSDDCFTPKPAPPPLPGTISGTSNPSGAIGTAVTTSPPPSGACGATSGLNCAAAIAFLQANAHGYDTYNGYCAVAIRNALNAGGLTQFANGQGNAYQYGPVLLAAHFTAVYSGTYTANSATAFAYQGGDIAVFQPVANHPNGHITMYTGSQWISDTVQPYMASNQSDYINGHGSFTVYRP